MPKGKDRGAMLQEMRQAGQRRNGEKGRITKQNRTVGGTTGVSGLLPCYCGGVGVAFSLPWVVSNLPKFHQCSTNDGVYESDGPQESQQTERHHQIGIGEEWSARNKTRKKGG